MAKHGIHRKSMIQKIKSAVSENKCQGGILNVYSEEYGKVVVWKCFGQHEKLTFNPNNEWGEQWQNQPRIFFLSAKRWRKHSVRTLRIPEWSADTLRRENSNWYLSQRRISARTRMKMIDRAYAFVTPKTHHDVRSEEFDESWGVFPKSSSRHPWTREAPPTCS